MFFGTGELSEAQLRSESFFRRRRPLVFLNMCQSASLRPGLSSPWFNTSAGQAFDILEAELQEMTQQVRLTALAVLFSAP